jgi:hypothetical protein
VQLTFAKFEGTQVYGTICQSCKYRSETRSGFLEIEISFKVREVGVSSPVVDSKRVRIMLSLRIAFPLLFSRRLFLERTGKPFPNLKLYFTDYSRADISAQAVERCKMQRAILNCRFYLLFFTSL